MANRLADSTSPYLLQHADNPVDWWPWSEEAFDEARRRDVPVLLSVGYAACHWCHVMAHESFEDDETAAIMNRNFVNIKVDREERPDVDAVYMAATQAMTGQGGWPMTCFLTPDGEPFYCGTYSPPEPRPGIPSFRQLMTAVVDAWTTRGDEVREAAGQIVAELAKNARPLPESTVDDEVLDGAVVSMLAEYDRAHGGFGRAPKFPPSMILEFLLRHHERTGSVQSLSLAEGTIEAMARGGMYDQLGGGFARYSVDAGWVVPHFEKMLYDNALLLRAYAHFARRTGSKPAERIAVETAEFLAGALRTEEGGFAAALDADTNGVEGLTYVWTPSELVEVLGSDDGVWAAEVFNVTAEGTFEEGASTLQYLQDVSDLDRLASVRERLLEARAGRPQPARDDKVVTAWNGLAIGALAEAGAALGQPAWIGLAATAASLLVRVHLVDGRLRRTSRDGVVGTAAGVLEDYGCLADGLLALHQATGAEEWLEVAVQLLDTALARFADPAEPGVFHDTADDAEKLVGRPADVSDNASPAGASSLAGALLTASALVGYDKASRYREAAEAAVTRAGLLVARAPRFAGHWLTVAEAIAQGPLQVAIATAHGDPRGESLRDVALAHAPGGAVVLAGAPDSVPLLADRPLIYDAPAAYVCRGYVCDRPVSSTDELLVALERR
ncbi:thioredoxin domain-containing protein [Kutzneria chonburiensis]|uniref:Thioredoxin domain-containing protein n=1 Tax=Kutzneria chonburiensis TaxID=1483604 RepID=A0ABV6N403_9PSEU|nr:thioredoxin domain-containing protein [Kutzneria chonburiensis]